MSSSSSASSVLPTPVLPTKDYAAFLFDMDGTILTSTAAAERVWGRWAAEKGLDVEAFLPTMHGRRGIDTITDLALPGVDPVVEAEKILQGEIEDVEGVVALGGAAEFLASLPQERWAIVTSSPLELAKARLAAAGIPIPKYLVSAEDVTIGKPNPQGYRLGAERLGAKPEDVLVFEDVVAGIRAGEAAGAEVMVITATHSHPIDGGQYRMADYQTVAAHVGDDGRLSIRSK
ncbi:sugar-phosphatase [Rhizobium sp. NFR07]|uniref:HAD-IA family hydrolase n=1 Tax=Rhizobium sp. NFR07 TaxID=1566262 RepID=UPI0008E20783|nr:HAD-IA family hydrolase [Rhizobium sp. NFR07]SFB43693.1 sugar-phosphatase [Rhizobium sp. NFR07]